MCQPEAGKAELVDLVAFGDRVCKYMIFIYVIQSRGKNFRYVGITNNFFKRIKEHNSGKSKSTRPYVPFDLKLQEEYSNYSEARKREKFLKSGQGRKFLDTL